MDEIQKQFMGGNRPTDLTSLIPAGDAASRYKLERKLDADLKKELYVLISGLGLKYELIYDSSSTETIIFSKSQVDDVTTDVKQAIIDLQKK